mmetsp:Transcript_11310/g.45960  ORF Transcript_11310/g.45960 Transcript_11310/m.45960 type:complete len:255 (+) Transcript_11310:427-1191(+)
MPEHCPARLHHRLRAVAKELRHLAEAHGVFCLALVLVDPLHHCGDLFLGLEEGLERGVAGQHVAEEVAQEERVLAHTLHGLDQERVQVQVVTLLHHCDVALLQEEGFELRVLLQAQQRRRAQRLVGAELCVDLYVVCHLQECLSNDQGHLIAVGAVLLQAALHPLQEHLVDSRQQRNVREDAFHLLLGHQRHAGHEVALLSHRLHDFLHQCLEVCDVGGFRVHELLDALSEVPAHGRLLFGRGRRGGLRQLRHR